MAEQLDRLEARLSYTFRDRTLLERALTHPGFVSRQPGFGRPHNQALKFLGDSILKFVVADLLHRRDPHGPEGRKSRLLSYLVSAECLLKIADGLGLLDAMFMDEPVRALARKGVATRPLSDAFEAIVAAMYLDGGLEASRDVIERHAVPLLDAGVPSDSIDQTGVLKEYLAKRGFPEPIYEVVERGSQKRRRFIARCRVGEVTGEGRGTSKKAAQQGAAREALAALGVPQTREASAKD